MQNAPLRKAEGPSHRMMKRTDNRPSFSNIEKSFAIRLVLQNIVPVALGLLWCYYDLYRKLSATQSREIFRRYVNWKTSQTLGNIDNKTFHLAISLLCLNEFHYMEAAKQEEVIAKETIEEKNMYCTCATLSGCQWLIFDTQSSLPRNWT